MKNLTITLPDELAQRIRVEAAKAGKSMSRYVAERLIADTAAGAADQAAGLRAYLAGPLLDLTDDEGRAPARDELNG